MDGGLTPEMIHDVRFARARRGYRVEDVDAFLAKVAEGVRALRSEASALRSRLAELEDELPASQARHVLLAATAVANTLVAEAARDAEAAAAARHRSLVSTAGTLLRATEACDQALATADELRAELKAAGDAFRPLAQGVEDPGPLLPPNLMPPPPTPLPSASASAPDAAPPPAPPSDAAPSGAAPWPPPSPSEAARTEVGSPDAERTSAAGGRA